MERSNWVVRLSMSVIGFWSLGYGVISLIFPRTAIDMAGVSDTGESAMFHQALFGAVLVPWGLGLLLSVRRRRAGVWAGLALVNSLAALVVLVFFLGRETIHIARAWPFVAVYGATALGIASFGRRELRGAGFASPNRDYSVGGGSRRTNQGASDDQGSG